MSTNLQNLTANLRSSKATDRTNALESLRETFKRDKIVLSLNASDWLVVYNALFDAFGAEKTASLKSGNLPTGGTGVGAAAVRRLRSVAETIRWMTERSVERITRKVVGALISHFLSHLNLRGGLFEPVALSYIKALHCLVGFRPHLEHMEAVTWIKLVEMSFNAVLGLSLRQPFDPKADDWAEEPAQDVTESGPDAQSEEEYSDTPPTPRRKRQRGNPMHNPTPASREATPRAQEVHAVSHEQREFMALLAALLRDSYAPILSKDNPHLPGAILHRLRLVLSKYPGESSLYHDYLAALSVTLSRLSINQQSLVHKFAVATWDGLIGMWGSKSNRSKEDLVVVLRSLFPYLTFEFGLGDVSPRPSYCDELTHLWKLLGTEAERRGVEGLSLDLVRLCIQDRDDLEGSPAFVTKTFRPSWDFDVGQSLTWATLDLQAECAQKVKKFQVFMITLLLTMFYCATLALLIF